MTANYDFDTMTVSFIIKINGQDIHCAISAEALQDHFGARSSGPNLVAIFQTHRTEIESVAKRKFAHTPLSTQNKYLLKSQDF